MFSLEIVKNLACILVALRGLPLQAAQYDAGQIVGQIRVDQLRILCRLLEEQRFERRFTDERHLARYHLIEDHPERIEVAAMVQRPPFNLLGRHVARRAEELAGVCDAGATCFERFGEAEVRNVGGAFPVDQHVLGLQIAVHDSCGVSGFQGLAELTGDRDTPVDRQSPFPFQLLVQVLALDISHRDELDAFDVA